MAVIVGVHGAFHEPWGPHPATQVVGTDGPAALVDQIGRYFDDPAIHDAVGADLLPPLHDGAGRWPPCVRRWTNITAVHDPVADGRPLAAVFEGVVEARVDNGHRAHDPEPHLCAQVTGAAIATAMG